MAEIARPKNKKKGKSKTKIKLLEELSLSDGSNIVNVLTVEESQTSEDTSTETPSEDVSVGTSFSKLACDSSVLEEETLDVQDFETQSLHIPEVIDKPLKTIQSSPGFLCDTTFTEAKVADVNKLEIPCREFMEPSAPVLSLEVNLEVQLPPEVEIEEVCFPATLEDSLIKFIESKEASVTMKPFTDEQLKSFYFCQQLEDSDVIVESFLCCQKGLDNHKLYECLSSYLQSRQNYRSGVERIEQLEKDSGQILSSLWTVETREITRFGECHDKNQVKACSHYTVAHFNVNGCSNLSRNFKLIRENIQEQISLYMYRSSLCKQQIDSLIYATERFELHKCISILFMFLRRPIKDPQFVSNVRQWLDYLAFELLKNPRDGDYLFLAHHVMRCPAGLSRWAWHYLQTPDWNPYNPEENTDHMNTVICLLSIINSTVIGREGFLKHWLNDPDQERHSWVFLDSDGDEDGCDGGGHFVMNLTDSDVLSMLNQVPVANIYRYLFRIKSRDDQDVYDTSVPVAENQWLKIFAVYRNLLRILDCGLEIYNSNRYKNVAKKLGQLIVHAICNLRDFWDLFWQQHVVDLPMESRLLAEFDYVMVGGISILIKHRKQRLWQFLNHIPFQSLFYSARSKVWIRLHCEIYGGNVDEDSFRSSGFWSNFVGKLMLLPEPDLFIFMVTLSSLIGYDTEADPLIDLIIWELVELSLVNETCRELCWKTGRELLMSICSRIPRTISFILERLAGCIHLVGKIAILFFKDFSLECWHPVELDLKLLKKWILNFPLNSVEQQLAVIVLSGMNWGWNDAGTRSFLSTKTHIQVALLLVEVMKNKEWSSPGSVAALPSLVTDYVQFVSSFLRSWNWNQFNQWAWQLALQLRLHILDSYPVHKAWIVSDPQKAFQKVPALEQDPRLQILRDGIAAKDPMSCFVALCLTDAGHSIPAFGSVGLDLLSSLCSAFRYREIIFVLEKIFPLFLHCPDALYVPKFFTIFQSIIAADNTYYKLAKSLLKQEFPGKFLQLMASVMEHTTTMYTSYNLREPSLILSFWANLLTQLPKWNMDQNILYLLDILCRISFTESGTADVLKQCLQCAFSGGNVIRPSRGLASRVGNWVSGTVEANQNDPAPASIIAPNPSNPYLTWMILDLEMEQQKMLWKQLVVELQPGKHKSVEQAIKFLVGNLKTPNLTMHHLCLIRYIQFALQISIQHPLMPLILQRFFLLYFARPDAGNTDTWSVGERIMKSTSSSLTLFNRLRNHIAECLELGKDSIPEIAQHFQAFTLWLKDEKLLEPNVYIPTLPPSYLPERFLQIFQDSEILWLDLYDRQTVGEERFKLRQVFSDERAILFQNSSRTCDAKCYDNHGSDRLLHRLKFYEPVVPLKALPIHPPFNPLPLTVFQNTSLLLKFLQPHLRVICQSAEQFNRRLAELTALDCQFLELIPEEYFSSVVEQLATVKCSGTQNSSCSGAAVIRLSFSHWKSNESIRTRMSFNQQESGSLRNSLLNYSLESLCMAALFLEHCTDEILKRCSNTETAQDQSKFIETGAALFYTIVELVNEETNLYPPTKQLLSTCIDHLGQRCIAGNPQQCRALVTLLSVNGYLAGILAPHFTPVTAIPTPESTEAFLDAYRLVTTLSKTDMDLIFVLLTKFDIRQWLNSGHSQHQDRLKLLKIIGSALETFGLEPAENCLVVHEVLRRHLQQLFLYNFPESYKAVLELLLSASENQRCCLISWCDFINTLGQGLIQFRPELTIQQFRSQVLQYTTLQTLFDLNQLLDTAAYLSHHFCQDRQMHGLYGLYPKYRPYIQPLALFFLMIGHVLCSFTVQHDAGTPSDHLVNQLWTILRDLFSPWVLPYSQQQVTTSCAGWIQQLSSDRALLLPWIAADNSLASSMVSSMTSCINFLHEIVPAQQGALSHALTFYLHGYCRLGTKSHIYQVIHEEFQTLPWESFVPLGSDLEQLVRVTSQFLPEAHSFLAMIFVRLPVGRLVGSWKAMPSPNSRRIFTCLLHLYVRLAVEPAAKQNPLMKRALEQACTFSWDHIDRQVYDQVTNWYISTCDPYFVIQPYTKRKDPVPASNDAVVFRLLKAASGYKSSSDNAISTADTLVKRQMFIKSWIRLTSVAASRYRSSIQNQSDIMENAIAAILQFITRNSSLEYCYLLQEYLQAISSASSISSELEDCLCKWIRTSINPTFIEGVLKSVQPQSGNEQHIVSIIEVCLEHFDGSWSSAMSLMGLPEKYSKVSKTLIQASIKKGCILTWYALVKSDLEPAVNEIPAVLEQLLATCKSFPLSEALEPKLGLVYERLLSTLHRVENPHDEGVAVQLTSIQCEFSHLLSSWADDNKGWLSSIGLGKTPSLTSKGRSLARMISCFLQNRMTLPEHVNSELTLLEKSKNKRVYYECQSVIEIGLELLSKKSTTGTQLLKQILPLLYPQKYLNVFEG